MLYLCYFSGWISENREENQTLVLPVLRERMDWLLIVFIFSKKKGTEHGHVHKAERDISMRLVQEIQRVHSFTFLRPLSIVLQTPTTPTFWKKAKGSKAVLFQDATTILKCSCHFCWSLFFFFSKRDRERERERERWGGRARERERENLKQVSCPAQSPMQPRSQGPEIKSRTLNRLSHSGTPIFDTV